MKTKLIGLLLFILCVNGLAQVKFGVKAGISSSSIKSENITIVNGASSVTFESVSDAVVGFQGGFALQVSLLGFYVQPELLFSTSGGNIRLTDVTGSRLIEQKFNRIDIPVLVGMKLGPLRAGLGPVFSTTLSSKSELADFAGYDDKFNSSTVGYQLGVGLDISKIFIDLKYEGNLSKLGNGVTIAGNSHSFDSRARQFILSVGLFF